MFWWMTNTMQLFEFFLHITKDVKTKMAANYGKKIVLGIRRAAINPNIEI